MTRMGMDNPEAEERRQRRMEDARDDRDRRMAAEAGGAFGHPGLEFAMGMHRQGMQNHANAAGAINSAIGKEMESRVAQQREMRRMAHEKELARMRLEAEAKRTEEMLRRMELMQRDDLPPGVISRIRIDGRGRVTHG